LVEPLHSTTGHLKLPCIRVLGPALAAYDAAAASGLRDRCLDRTRAADQQKNRQKSLWRDLNVDGTSTGNRRHTYYRTTPGRNPWTCRASPAWRSSAKTQACPWYSTIRRTTSPPHRRLRVEQPCRG